MTDEDLVAKRFTAAFGGMLRFQVERARGYFDRRAELLLLLPTPARVDVDLFVRGGRAILDAIEQVGFDVLTRRPTVGKWRKARLLLGAVGAKVRGLLGELG